MPRAPVTLKVAGKAVVAALAVFAAPAAASAAPPSLQAAIGNPSDLKVNATVRVRYEALDGQSRIGLNAEDDLVAIKSTLQIEWHHGNLRVGGELDDSRAYRGKSGSSVSANDVNAFEPIQAYVGGNFPGALGKGTTVSFQAGRFTMLLGSRRFVSADEYRNATSAMTGLRMDLKARDGTAVTLFYVLPQLHLPDDQPSVLRNRFALDHQGLDLTLWGSLVSRPLSLAGLSAEAGFYRLDERDTPGRLTRDRHLSTISARLAREPKAGRLDFDLEGAVQRGRISASTAPGAALLDVDAGFVHAGIGYSFAGRAKARLSATYDYVSGDGAGANYNRFDTLYGSRRTEFGPGGIYSTIGRANISSPGVRLELAPGKRFDAMLAYRAMWLASRTDAFSTTGVRDVSGTSGRFAGHQFDVRFRYWLVPGLLRGEINADWIAKGRFLKVAPNAPQTGDTHYVSTALTASF
ncbi:MAG: alginate export family protein [Novosphingobium sp.]